MSFDSFSRRVFFKTCGLSTLVMLHPASSAKGSAINASHSGQYALQRALDLAPARWIWYPSHRCLANSVVLFRKSFQISSAKAHLKGWVLADSRYIFYCNGRRIQAGPAPSDPRWMEADPLELEACLKPGENTLGILVCFFGLGDGTAPIGKPGLIANLTVEDGPNKTTLHTDKSWSAHLARSWPPGQYKRWYLRSLQEQFSSRKHPHGWSLSDFAPDTSWLPAMELGGDSDKPSVCNGYPEYMWETGCSRDNPQIRSRSIPLLTESLVPVQSLAESMWIEWHQPAEDYFDCVVPNGFKAIRSSPVMKSDDHSWTVKMDSTRAAALTFEFKEQIVGYPRFTVDAPEGTIIEMMVHEGHEVGGPALLNSHFNSWCRFICKGGKETFEPIDYESFRWLQLHIRKGTGNVTVSDIGCRRRLYPWPHEVHVRLSDPLLQKLMDASVNTLYNSAQDIIVDGMGRERQQYSGDCGHQLHAIFHGFGDYWLPARYLNTFSQGLTKDGYFLDCWPAFDRLARLMERQMGLTKWGPLLDHGVGFNFDAYYTYLYSGQTQELEEVFPRLVIFFEYLQSIVRDGLLPVEDIGIPAVWIDHIAYKQQRHKQCAFNLYASAMARHALAPLAEVFNKTEVAHQARRFSDQLLKATQRAFWSPKHGLFINNLPWIDVEKEIRMCDRSLATAVLFDQCPGNQTAAGVDVLIKTPPEMGLSYPANAGWRLWALAKAGQAQAVIDDLRSRWGKMDSVHLNNTLQENWEVQPDSGSQWSHCPVAPLYVLYMSLAGLMPLEPGFRRFQIRPQLGDLEFLELVSHTPAGPIRLNCKGKMGNRQIQLRIPPGISGELMVPEQEKLSMRLLGRENGFSLYEIPSLQEVSFTLREI